MPLTFPVKSCPLSTVFRATDQHHLILTRAVQRMTAASSDMRDCLSQGRVIGTAPNMHVLHTSSITAVHCTTHIQHHCCTLYYTHPASLLYTVLHTSSITAVHCTTHIQHHCCTLYYTHPASLLYTVLHTSSITAVHCGSGHICIYMACICDILLPTVHRAIHPSQLAL